MDSMNPDEAIYSVLRDPKGEVVRIGPGLTDPEYGRHMGKVFAFLYDAAGEIRDHPDDPASGYLRMAMDCAIAELKEINEFYMAHPIPHVVEWTRHIQQFDNCEKVVDYITSLAETVCSDDYNGADAARAHRMVKGSLLEASVPVSEILDREPMNPPTRIFEFDNRGRLFRGRGDAEAAKVA
jgi:hypothetical protein